MIFAIASSAFSLVLTIAIIKLIKASNCLSVISSMRSPFRLLPAYVGRFPATPHGVSACNRQAIVRWGYASRASRHSQLVISPAAALFAFLNAFCIASSLDAADTAKDWYFPPLSWHAKLNLYCVAFMFLFSFAVFVVLPHRASPLYTPDSPACILPRRYCTRNLLLVTVIRQVLAFTLLQALLQTLRSSFTSSFRYTHRHTHTAFWRIVNTILLLFQTG